MTRRIIKRVILLKFILITFQLHAVDDKEDFVYDLSLATQGISVSQFNTGVNYSLGRGIQKDLEKAVLNATLFELWNKNPELEEDDRQTEAEVIAKRITKDRLAKIENNPQLLNFNKAVSIANLDCYAMGSITAEKPDTDYSNRESL